MKKLVYLYNAPIPSSLTAWIQILNTCRALCDLDLVVEIIANRMTDTKEGCLEFFGISAHENFRIREWNCFPSTPPDLNANWVISRDERGIKLIERGILMREGPTPHRIIYEAHRVCFLNRNEKFMQAWGLSGFLSRTGDIAAFIGILMSRATRELRRAEAQAVSRADAIVTVSPGVMNDLKRFFPHEKPVLVLPSGTEIPASRTSLSDRTREIVYAGKLLNRKGFGTLLRAMQWLPGKQLTVIGGKPTQIASWQKKARQLKVDSRIEFLGYVEPARVQNYLRQAQVSICPMAVGSSEQYSSPLKIVEAWAAGTPVVVNGTPAVLSDVHPGVDALVAPLGDARKLAETISMVLSDRCLAERLAVEGFKSASRRSWRNRAAQLKDFLESLPVSSSTAQKQSPP